MFLPRFLPSLFPPYSLRISSQREIWGWDSDPCIRVNERHSSAWRIASSAPRTSRRTPFLLSIFITCSRKRVTMRRRLSRFSIQDFFSSYSFLLFFFRWLNIRFYQSIVPFFIFHAQYSSYLICMFIVLRRKFSPHPFFIRSIVCSLRRSITIEDAHPSSISNDSKSSASWPQLESLSPSDDN